MDVEEVVIEMCVVAGMEVVDIVPEITERKYSSIKIQIRFVSVSKKKHCAIDPFTCSISVFRPVLSITSNVFLV